MSNIPVADNLFTKEEQKLFEEYQEICDTIKTMEQRKDSLQKQIIARMKELNITSVSVNDTKYTMCICSRRAVIKATEEEFIAELANGGYKHLLKHSIKPDIESIQEEVDVGKLSNDFVDKYIRVISYDVLRYKE